MTRNEWELQYMKQMGDTIWLEDCSDERRLVRIDQKIDSALEVIEEQIQRIRKLKQLKNDYVLKEDIKWAELPSISVTYGTGTCRGCGKTRGSGCILNGIPCECGYVPERSPYLLDEMYERIPIISREETLPIIIRMCRDTDAGDLRWFTLTPGIGVCFGIAECNKKATYVGTEFGNYTGTIYDRNGNGKFSLRSNHLNGWIDRDLGEELLLAIKKERV